MGRQIDIMRKREETMAEVIDSVSRKSDGFNKPPITTIGGYGLRAFVPFSRYTRDCDFVVPKGKGWAIDSIREWFRGDMEVVAFEKHSTYGFLRLIRAFRLGNKTVRVSMDFMEGEVRGRTDEQIVLIDGKFIENRKSVALDVGTRTMNLFVPEYLDYFILKVVSGRPSDVRDVAALVWKNGIPSGLPERVGEMVPHPALFKRMIAERIIPDMSDKRFVDSWRGMFVTTLFGDKEREEVLGIMEEMLQE